MSNTNAGKKWIVRKRIEEDQMNHHYKRLSNVKPQIFTGLQQTISGKKLSKSCHDVRFSHETNKSENKFNEEFHLEYSAALKDKKFPIADNSYDMMTRHNKYFTQSKLFTPRLVRKIVRPTTAVPTRTSRENSLPYILNSQAFESLSIPIENYRKNISDDSALEDDHSSQSSESSLRTNQLISFKFRQWLKEQEEECSYVKLMCDITADLLQRQLCTYRNVKEIIAVYVRKTSKKFSVSESVLNKRLYEDLLIPTDSGFDLKYYGSSSRSRIIYNPKSSNDIRRSESNFGCNFNDTVYDNGIQSRTLASTSKAKAISYGNCETIQNYLSPVKTSNYDAKVLSNEKKNSNPEKPLWASVEEPVADVELQDGYCSDFASDTDNDIEEIFECE